MVLLGVSPLSPNNFFGRMKQTLDRSQRRELLVFVHGYNVSFATAALRTAQLAYDLKLDGAPVLYSWPSQAALAGYPVDETNVEWTVPHLEAFLTDLAQRSGAGSIDLIAHSMGNRALTRALERIAGKMTAAAKPPFRQILLTAPDVDAGVFSQIAQVFRKTGQRVTLYASSNDQALKASKSFHGFPRAGDTVPDIVVLPDLDTVDVSLVDTGLLGHSYYGDNTSVLTDIFHLLRDGKAPDQRGLAKRTKNGMAYWAFVP
jgi:esterase/lipase superfamily enzyme